MKSFNCICIVFILIAFGCSNSGVQSKKVDKNIGEDTTQNSKDKATINTELDSKNMVEFYEYEYSVSNDSATKVLLVKKGNISKKNEVPDSLKFKLIIKSKSGAYLDKIVEGVAGLVSANESFSDASDKDGGAYSAADYVYNAKGECDLKIRIDVDDFAACAISTTCDSIRQYFKNYPAYDVLKKSLLRSQ